MYLQIYIYIYMYTFIQAYICTLRDGAGVGNTNPNEDSYNHIQIYTHICTYTYTCI
jgi:hypothetical protein